jgi:hypothetical protein
MTLLFLSLGFVFYRLRNLDKVKIDFDDRSVELESEDNDGKDEDATTGVSDGTTGDQPKAQD